MSVAAQIVSAPRRSVRARSRLSATLAACVLLAGCGEDAPSAQDAVGNIVGAAYQFFIGGDPAADAAAAIETHDALRAAADAALTAGDAETALAQSDRLLEHAIEAFGRLSRRTAVAYNERGNALSMAGRLSDAAGAYRVSIIIDRQLTPVDDASIAVSLANLADTQLSLDAVETALESAKEAAALAEGAQMGRLDRAWTFEILGDAQRGVDAAAAAVSYRRALDALEEEPAASAPPDPLGEDAGDVAIRLFGLLGRAQSENGRTDDAVDSLRRAIDLRSERSGEDNPDLIPDLNELGDILTAADRFAEAEDVYRRDLALSTAAEGETSASVAHTYEDLAALFCRSERYDDCLIAADRALAGRETVDGDGALSGNPARRLRGEALWRLGRADEAIVALEQTAAIGAAGRPSGADLNLVGEALRDIGHIHLEQRRYDPAIENYRRAAAAFESAYGPESAQLAWTLNALGDALFETGDLDGAILHYERDLAISVAVDGESSDDTLHTFNNLVAAQVAASRFQQAVATAGRYVDAAEANPDAKAFHLPAAHRRLGEALLKRNRRVKAIESFERAIALMGADDYAGAPIDRGYAFWWLASARSGLAGAEVASLEAYRQALATLRQEIGDNHPDTRGAASEYRAALARHLERVPSAPASFRVELDALDASFPNAQ